MEYVSFVILHYKDYSVTDTCVQSILAMEQQERIRIVVVDNDIQKKEKDRQELLQKYQENSRIKVLQIKMAAFLMQIIKDISMPENISGKVILSF